MTTEQITSTTGHETADKPRGTLGWLTDSTPLRPHAITIALYAVLAILGVAYVISKASGEPNGELRISFYGQHDSAMVIDDIRHDGERLVAVIENRTDDALFGKISCRSVPSESLVGHSRGFGPVAANSVVTVDLAAPGLDENPTSGTVRFAAGCSVRWSDVVETGANSVVGGARDGNRAFDRQISDLLKTRLGKTRSVISGIVAGTARENGHKPDDSLSRAHRR